MSAKQVAVGGAAVIVAVIIIGATSGGKKHHGSATNAATDAPSSYALDTSLPSDLALPSDVPTDDAMPTDDPASDSGSATAFDLPCKTYLTLSKGDRFTEADAYLATYGDGSYATTANARDVRSIFDVTCKSYPDEDTDAAFNLAKLGLS